jgi:thiol-disulfide isomerase/thioredoxin
MNPARRELVVLGAVAAGAALAGALAGALALQSRSGAAELLSSRFPDLAGQDRRLSEWQGRPFLCNFWATWCAPCREELPLLDAARQRHAAIGLEVVGIAVDNAANVGEYLKSVPVRFPVLVAGAAAIDLMRRLGNAAGGLPFTVSMDAAGRVRGRKLGAYSAPQLEAEVSALFR